MVGGGACPSMFDALPEESSSRLGFDGMRSGMHRWLVQQRHGWFAMAWTQQVVGGAYSSTSTMSVLVH